MTDPFLDPIIETLDPETRELFSRALDRYITTEQEEHDW